jgi:cytochrome P450
MSVLDPDLEAKSGRRAAAGRHRAEASRGALPHARPDAAAPRPAAPQPHAKRLGALAAARALRNNPITAFARQAYEAPVLKVNFLQRLVMVNAPEAIEHVLVGNAANYRKSELQQRRLRAALGDGLLTAEGETWRKARRITAPLFSPKAIGLLFADMRQAAAAMRDRWLDRDAAERSAPLDLAAEFQRLTYEIVSRSVFSGALDAQRAKVHANMAIYFESFGRIDLSSLLKLPTWLPTRSWWRSRPALGAFRTIVERVVAERVENEAREIDDLLERLMRAPDPKTGAVMEPEAVSDNVLTFLAAGHETTGNALSWALYLLALFPDAEARVVAELQQTFGDSDATRDRLEALVFTRAVVNEALRLYPPAPFIGREALGEDVLGGYPIARGEQILIAPWLVHRHRGLWEEPEDFRPERFLPPALDRIPRGAFIPFGLGPRVCIGQGFAVQEILTVLATVLPAFRFALAAPEAVFPLSRITLRVKGGLPMLVSPR